MTTKQVKNKHAETPTVFPDPKEVNFPERRKTSVAYFFYPAYVPSNPKYPQVFLTTPTVKFPFSLKQFEEGRGDYTMPIEIDEANPGMKTFVDKVKSYSQAFAEFAVNSLAGDDYLQIKEICGAKIADIGMPTTEEFFKHYMRSGFEVSKGKDSSVQRTILQVYVPREQIENVKVFMNEENKNSVSAASFLEEARFPHWGSALIQYTGLSVKKGENFKPKFLLHQLRIFDDSELLPDYAEMPMKYEIADVSAMV